MKSQLVKKLLAGSLATAMTISLMACGGSAPAANEAAETPADTTEVAAEAPAEDTAAAEPEEEESLYTVLTDEDGNVYDLGGMEIIVRDWWSGDPAEPTNDYEEAREEYRDWIQETYNFTIKEQAISDWGSAPADFTEYATTGGDENYIFVVRDDPAITNAMTQGLMYDLSTLDCLDFNEAKFQKNKLHEQYTKGNSIYAMFAGDSEPRTGVYFNKRLLTEAGIDPESLYELQANHEWTWDKFTEIMDTVQRDIDNDGVIDVYGVTQNSGNMISAAVWSNGGEYVGQKDGKYVYRLEDPETVEGLTWAVETVLAKYSLPYPDGAEWDYYKEAYKSGMAAFMVDDAYCAGDFLSEMEDDFGFVAFPMGPQSSEYTNCWSNNPHVIPACYDADKAWKIAFAWNLYTDDVPGYEDYEGWKAGYYSKFRDTEAVDQTLEIMVNNGMITYDGIIPEMQRGSDFLWGLNANTVVSEAIDSVSEYWKGLVDAANG